MEKERKPRLWRLLKVLGHMKGLEKPGMEQTGRQEGLRTLIDPIVFSALNSKAVGMQGPLERIYF